MGGGRVAAEFYPFYHCHLRAHACGFNKLHQHLDIFTSSGILQPHHSLSYTYTYHLISAQQFSSRIIDSILNNEISKTQMIYDKSILGIHIYVLCTYVVSFSILPHFIRNYTTQVLLLVAPFDECFPDLTFVIRI